MGERKGCGTGFLDKNRTWLYTKAPERSAMIELLRECRELIGSGHNDFTHDYQRDANKCPTCKLLKRLDAALAGKDAEQNAAPQSTFNRSGEPDASIGGTAAGAAPGLPEDTQTYLKRKYPEVTEPNKLAYYMEAAELFAQDALRAVKERDEAWAAVRDAPNAARLKDSLPDTVAAVYSWRSKHAATIAAARRGR